ncbi:MAG: hypothetical protein RL536_153 [Candidatus Parcubacteria bacterium]|jgi:cytochrome c biogenesis protein CcdA/thiol-disulfide isomerase/thioredoxin
MAFFIISFLAGVLTILAPCILPLLPVILAGSVTETKNRRRPFIIIGSLSVSVFIFTLLLKGTTALITVSPTFWSYVSAIILLAFGLTLLFPETWAKIVLKIPGHNKPDKWISKGYGEKQSFWTDVIIGAALGPVFTTCSPTFFVILATVLPQSLSVGLIDLAAYIIGLALSLLLVAWIGQKLVDKLEWATNPYGWFKKVLGILFIVIAVSIAVGFDKKVEADILRSGFFDVTRVEQTIKQYFEGFGRENSTTNTSDNSVIGTSTNSMATSKPKSQTLKPVLSRADIPRNPYTEIVNIAGYINSNPFKLADLVGKKVILIDFIDYTCINCQRTFPYLNDWYSKYKDQGFEIVAIHTPEFSFEKDIENVRNGINKFGLKFPIVLDNDYSTWNAYRNQYWPHKYLIDIHGNVVYDHIGEGAYEETEQKIVDELNVRKMFLNEEGVVDMGGSTVKPLAIQTQSSETYFGAFRNQNFGNGQAFTTGEGNFTIPNNLQSNAYYLGGDWKIDKEYAENQSAMAKLSYIFTASNMYVVAQTSSDLPASSIVEAEVLIDGKRISAEQSGTDVVGGTLKIKDSRLYHLFKSNSAEKHRIDIIFSKPKVRVFTFTFG